MEAQNAQQATGRRKEASAQVRLKPGSGKITVNDKPIEKYFMRETTRMIIRQPFEATNTLERFDVDINVRGGGSSGQGGAVRHGISRVLAEMDPEFHKTLKRGGFLTRDSRVKERKKYGRKKARKRFQYSKR